MTKKKVLWIIPARSGSKSITDKNIKILGKAPLLVHRFLVASKSKYSCDIWLSTDSKNYANLASQYGLIVPFIRPKHLATDNANSNDVALHAMGYAEQNSFNYDFIGLLEPTSPFVNVNDIDAAVEQLEKNTEADSIVAVKENRPSSIFVQKDSYYLKELYDKIKSLEQLSRQMLSKEITPSGGFYISRWERFLSNKSFYTAKTIAYEVDAISALEIDEPIDWDFAEFIITKIYKDELQK